MKDIFYYVTESDRDKLLGYNAELRAMLDLIVSRTCTCEREHKTPELHEDDCEYRAIAGKD